MFLLYCIVHDCVKRDVNSTQSLTDVVWLELDSLVQHVASRLDRRQNWVTNVTSEQHQLTSELAQFHDILLVDVVDVYRNVPYKLLHFARWYCHLSVRLSVCLSVSLSDCYDEDVDSSAGTVFVS